MRALMTFRITSITREHFYNLYRSSFKVSFKKFQELGHNHLKFIIKPKSPMGRDVDNVFLQEVILFFEIFFCISRISAGGFRRNDEVSAHQTSIVSE
jgi:hypothetical protein